MLKECAKEIFRNHLNFYNADLSALGFIDLIYADFEIELERLREDKNPPAQPTIIKSGDTFVAEYDGVDYLMVDGIENFRNIFDNESNMTCQQVFLRQLKFKYVMWKPISEIEITDEIAKLRPMMVNGNRKLLKLYGVDKKRAYDLILDPVNKSDILKLGFYMNVVHRLATVKDLRS